MNISSKVTFRFTKAAILLEKKRSRAKLVILWWTCRTATAVNGAGRKGILDAIEVRWWAGEGEVPESSSEDQCFEGHHQYRRSASRDVKLRHLSSARTLSFTILHGRSFCRAALNCDLAPCVIQIICWYDVVSNHHRQERAFQRFSAIGVRSHRMQEESLQSASVCCRTTANVYFFFFFFL